MSEKINDGGPAFPDCDGQSNYTGGLTVRDYFAAKAMYPIIKARSPLSKYTEAYLPKETKKMAEIAYKIADAMLKERENNG